MTGELIVDAFVALSQLKGQLDRVDDPLAENIAGYLNANWEAAKWQAPEVVFKYDEFAASQTQSGK